MALLLLAGVIGGAVLLYSRLFGHGGGTAVHAMHDPPMPPAPEPVPLAVAAAVDASAAPQPFTLLELTGTVEVGRGGTWTQLTPGQQLSDDDAVRTSDGSHAVLRSADGSELVLRENVDLTLRVSRTVASVALARGRVRAGTGSGTGLRFEITAGKTRAVGSGARDERFTVFAGAQGLVAVATERGEVRVLAEGKEVAVGSGEQTMVLPGRAPADPVAISPEMLLSVSWPRGATAGTSKIVGNTSPGSDVKVNGVTAVVTEDGHFEAEVGLKDGRIRVDAEDLVGRTKSLTSPLLVGKTGKESGPGLKVDPRDLWKKPKPPSKP